MNFAPHLISIGSGVLALLGVIALAIAWWSLSWPKTKGVVEVSFLDQNDAVLAVGLPPEFASPEERSAESHAFAYRYEVAGTKYLNHRRKAWGDFEWSLNSGGDSTGVSGKPLWSGARDLAKWYRPGAHVDVYYCPLNPSWSCVEPGGFVFGGLLLVAALVVFKIGPTLLARLA